MQFTEPRSLSNEPFLRTASLSAWNFVAIGMASPMILVCRLECWLAPRSQRLFHACGQICALFPGFIGMSVRRAFYVGTLRHCSARCHIGFGVLISHRSAILEDNVYVGNYAMLGDAILRRGCLIGSRTSILSQGDHHEMDAMGRWVTPDRPKLSATEIGEYAWIGEGAIVVAPVGRSAHVAAGTVVASHVPEYIMVAGNPARFVKRLFTPSETTDDAQREPKQSSDGKQ